jgi:hypothetical protein
MFASTTLIDTLCSTGAKVQGADNLGSTPRRPQVVAVPSHVGGVKAVVRNVTGDSGAALQQGAGDAAANTTSMPDPHTGGHWSQSVKASSTSIEQDGVGD